jgi:hypothetical protein
MPKAEDEALQERVHLSMRLRGKIAQPHSGMNLFQVGKLYIHTEENHQKNCAASNMFIKFGSSSGTNIAPNIS